MKTRNHNVKTKVKSPNIYTKRALLKQFTNLKVQLMCNYEHSDLSNQTFHAINSIVLEAEKLAIKIKV